MSILDKSTFKVGKMKLLNGGPRVFNLVKHSVQTEIVTRSRARLSYEVDSSISS